MLFDQQKLMNKGLKFEMKRLIDYYYVIFVAL